MRVHRDLTKAAGFHSHFLGSALAAARGDGRLSRPEYCEARRVQRAANVARHSPFAGYGIGHGLEAVRRQADGEVKFHAELIDRFYVGEHMVDAQQQTVSGCRSAQPPEGRDFGTQTECSMANTAILALAEVCEFADRARGADRGGRSRVSDGFWPDVPAFPVWDAGERAEEAAEEATPAEEAPAEEAAAPAVEAAEEAALVEEAPAKGRQKGHEGRHEEGGGHDEGHEGEEGEHVCPPRQGSQGQKLLGDQGVVQQWVEGDGHEGPAEEAAAPAEEATEEATPAGEAPPEEAAAPAMEAAEEAAPCQGQRLLGDQGEAQQGLEGDGHEGQAEEAAAAAPAEEAMEEATPAEEGPAEEAAAPAAPAEEASVKAAPAEEAPAEEAAAPDEEAAELAKIEHKLDAENTTEEAVQKAKREAEVKLDQEWFTKKGLAKIELKWKHATTKRAKQQALAHYQFFKGVLIQRELEMAEEAEEAAEAELLGR